MTEAAQIFFTIMGIAATGAVFLLALLMVFYSVLPVPDESNDGYRKDLCTYCGRLIPVDAPVDKDGRCYECRKGVDMLV